MVFELPITAAWMKRSFGDWTDFHGKIGRILAIERKENYTITTNTQAKRQCCRVTDIRHAFPPWELTNSNNIKLRVTNSVQLASVIYSLSGFW